MIVRRNASQVEYEPVASLVCIANTMLLAHSEADLSFMCESNLAAIQTVGGVAMEVQAAVGQKLVDLLGVSAEHVRCCNPGLLRV